MSPLRHRSWLCLSVMLLSAVETVLAVLISLVLFQASDPIGRSIAHGVLTLVAIIWAVLVLPGFVLAVLNRRLVAALILNLLAPLSFLGGMMLL